MIVGINKDLVPQELKDLPQWVNWAGIWSDGKFSKPPMKASGTNGSSTNPKSWSTFEEAMEALEKRGVYRDNAGGRHNVTLDGVGLGGLELTPYVGIDLDDCVEDGLVNDFARDIINSFSSYTEITVSGTGVRIWIKATKPENSWSTSTKHGGKIEVYSTGRFFTITGEKLAGTPDTIEERQTALDWLLRAYEPPVPPKPKRKPGAHIPKGEDMSAFLTRNDVRVTSVEEQSAGIKYNIVCPWVRLHSHGDASGTYVIEFHDGAKFFHCYHTHAEGFKWAHFAAEVEPQNWVEIKSPSKSRRTSENSEKADRGVKGGDKKQLSFTPSESAYLKTGEQNGDKVTRVTTILEVNEYMGEDVEERNFPIEMFPESIQRYIREVEESVRCPRDFVALGVLAILSAAIGNTRRINIKQSWSQSAALYCAIVGYPGTKKTPALKFATKPLRKKAMKMHEDFRQLMESYEEQLEHLDKNDDPPQKPIEYQNYIDDVTIEKVADILADNRRGVCLYKDELSSWLSSMDQYKGGKGGERPKWLSIYDNAMFKVQRKSQDTQFIPDPYVTIIGGIQPERIDLFGEEMGDGLIDRFLTVFPTPLQDVWTDQEVTQEAEEGYERVTRELCTPSMTFSSTLPMCTHNP